MAVLDAYVRVSRVGGREGDRYHSPDLQEASILRWIEREPDAELGVVVKEEDVSGGTRIDDRRLGELLARIEAGISEGIVVYETDRFGRDLTETLLAHRRIHEADGRLVGVEDGVDTSTPGGKSRLVQRAMMAEEYLDDVKRRWRRSTDRAVEQGKWPSRPPFGYRAENSRLVVHEDEAALVLRGFQMRASGASHLQIAQEIGRKKAAVAAMLRNRVYLGESRGQGGAVNSKAHEPIVSDELFAAVQSRVGERSPRVGRKRRYEPLLNGLIRCADCGYLLQVNGSTRKDGTRVPHYYCPSPSNNRPCERPAGGNAERVDDYVVSMLDLEDDRIADLFHGAERAWTQAKEKVKLAELELDQFVELAVGLDRERFQRGLTQRQEDLNRAKRELYELDDPGLGDDDLVVLQNVGDGPLVMDYRGRDPELDRRRMRRVIASVTLEAADPARRRWQPISERVTIRWVGEDG